jgi:hypothetical protein
MLTRRGNLCGNTMAGVGNSVSNAALAPDSNAPYPFGGASPGLIRLC